MNVLLLATRKRNSFLVNTINDVLCVGIMQYLDTQLNVALNFFLLMKSSDNI